MSAEYFTPNPNMQVNVMRMGVEQTPLIIIDDFASSTEALKTFAYEHAEYTPDEKTLYPGVRSPLPDSYIIKLLQAVYQPLYGIYGIELSKRVTPLSSYFSLLSLAPNALHLLQRMPHFDTNSSTCFAVLHYLAEGPHGGTGLYRHKPTKFERITEARCDQYISSAKQYIEQHGEPEPGYITGSNDHFEKFYEVEYKPNRLVIYPSNLLHSVTVDKTNDLSSDPKNGRLTANIFFEFK
ncbi:MAG: hypothetical protein ACJAZB_000598 [Psychrosphaera sp.]|jgi:hypothetical protein|uniref:DUF6445 family protein n=1 Tax=Psychrosphaera sp. F3M07 TaxID=2841560 RepID=UPI001C0847AA|nr:DUF6445 family protein [Psychrosphaera sp. F3M07]MBU2917239.1 hypothetical protein [Psychrosphaera sp. F3M07]